jgi:hypothetical protein
MFIFMILYICHNYARGMSKYISSNNLSSSNPRENTWDSVHNESIELIEAIREFSIKNVILEASDVIHGFIKHCIVKVLPEFVYSHWLCWIPVFFLVLPCTVKLGLRHAEAGCIRNHKNPANRGHICDFGKTTITEPPKAKRNRVAFFHIFDRDD